MEMKREKKQVLYTGYYKSSMRERVTKWLYKSGNNHSFLTDEGKRIKRTSGDKYEIAERRFMNQKTGNYVNQIALYRMPPNWQEL